MLTSSEMECKGAKFSHFGGSWETNHFKTERAAGLSGVVCEMTKAPGVKGVEWSTKARHTPCDFRRHDDRRL